MMQYVNYATFHTDRQNNKLSQVGVCNVTVCGRPNNDDKKIMTETDWYSAYP